MAVAIKGATREDRDLARKRRADERRARTYANEVAALKGPARAPERLTVVMRYLRAVLERAANEEVDNLAREIARTADEWNRR